MSLRQILISGGRMKPEERQWVYGASQASLLSEDGRPGRDFLFKTRGLSIDTVSGFRLGYVPSEIDHPFSERVVMPIFDAYDRLLALSVRPISQDKAVLKEFLKYWNERYIKGDHLYGLNMAKLAIVRSGFAILVEGQMDVLAMHSYGFQNTVAVLGGAFTPVHAMLLKRWTDQVVVMFDGDKAGMEHTDRCFEVLEAYGYRGHDSAKRHGTLRASRVVLSADDGAHDPDEVLQAHGSRRIRVEVAKSMMAKGMNCPKGWLN